MRTVYVFCECLMRSFWLDFLKGVGVSRSRLPASFVRAPVGGPSLSSLDMFDHSRGRCSHAPFTGVPPSRVSSPRKRGCLHRLARAAVTLFSSGRAAHGTSVSPSFLCVALLAGNATVLFSASARIFSDVLSRYLTSSRKSSGSGWSVSHGSCIFNVPISPWHDLHMLKFFLASILCFRLRLVGNDPPSPAPPPPSGGGGVGGEWGGDTIIQFHPPLHVAFLPLCTMEIHAWSLCPLRRTLFLKKKKRRGSRAPQRRFEKGLCLSPVSAAETQIYVHREGVVLLVGVLTSGLTIFFLKKRREFRASQPRFQRLLSLAKKARRGKKKQHDAQHPGRKSK